MLHNLLHLNATILIRQTSGRSLGTLKNARLFRLPGNIVSLHMIKANHIRKVRQGEARWNGASVSEYRTVSKRDFAHLSVTSVLQNTVLCKLTQFSLVEIYRCFGGIWYIHLEVDHTPPWGYRQQVTPVNVYQTTRRHIPQAGIIHCHGRDNLAHRTTTALFPGGDVSPFRLLNFRNSSRVSPPYTDTPT